MGWGWLDYSSDGGSTSKGSVKGCCSDWLFTVTPVPVPPAVWLFGSGLLGLVAVARRRALALPALIGKARLAGFFVGPTKRAGPLSILNFKS